MQLIKSKAGVLLMTRYGKFVVQWTDRDGYICENEFVHLDRAISRFSSIVSKQTQLTLF